MAFSTGVGSAVTTVDRVATFDAGSAIDISDHSEDGLLITSPSGSISEQPGEFNPFTSIAPGITGYFGVANESYVSIRPADSTTMSGVELRLGDLFGSGPGQPPDPRSTFVVWEARRDGELIGTDRSFHTLGTVVAWADPMGIDELRVGASGFPEFMAFGASQGIALDDLKVQIDTSADVTFSTGVGTAVTVADRRATFDVGGEINVSDYTEDSLQITTTAGTVAEQPANFNPFTAEAPGISGYFAVSNDTYVSIRPSDSSTITGIEFDLGDLFGIGPGQPPDARSTFLFWESYRDGVQTGTDRALLAVGTTVSWSDPSGIDELRVGASGFPAFTQFGVAQAIALDNLRAEVDSSRQVVFATGSDAVLTSVDRVATFDAGSLINAAGYSEDMLFVTDIEGSIAPQPGAFNPFTGEAPGVAGYFAVPSTSYVSIRSTDSADMLGIEFTLGDLFGVGPGQPPDPFSTYLVWETYRNGELTGTDRAMLADGTIVGWADPAGIDELRVGASGFSSYTRFGLPQAIAVDDLKVQLVAGGDVAFTTGAGSAVSSADRVATFDAGAEIDISNHSEDLLRVTSSQGSVAPQPGAFDPFTGVAPGTAGYYAVANTTYVSIRPVDSALMTAIEFRLGDLFGDGPGQPPDPFGTYLVWETYRDGTRTGTDRVFLPDGQIVGWASPTGIDELRVGASGFPSFTGFGIAQGIALDDLAVQLKTVTAPFSIAAFLPTSTGFRAEFDATIDPTVLNLFDTLATAFGPTDVSLRGSASGMVAGSLVIDPDSRAVTFIKSGGPLVADSYTASLRSARDGFTTVGGQLLDGDGDGVAGDDFIAPFDVAEPGSAALTVGLHDFVRGPGQEVNLPADESNGFPVLLSTTDGVRTVELQVRFDPTLLAIESVSLGAGMPAGSVVELDVTTAGLAVVSFSSPVDLPPDLGAIANVHASIPSATGSSIYGRSQVLDLDAVTVTNGAGVNLEVIADDAIHLASFFGDVSGNGRVNASDAALVARFVAQIDSGFTSSLLVDPVLVGDISGNGRVNAFDASQVARFVALIDVPQIPPIPAGVLIAGGSNSSREMRVPLSLAVGTVTASGVVPPASPENSNGQQVIGFGSEQSVIHLPRKQDVIHNSLLRANRATDAVFAVMANPDRRELDIAISSVMLDKVWNAEFDALFFEG